MFALSLIPGGEALGTVGILAALAGTLWALRRHIPHPTEFFPLSWFCRVTGIHSHDSFELIIDLHEAWNAPKDSKCYVYVECGRFDAQSETEVSSKDGNGQIAFFQRLPIRVRQRDDTLTLSMFIKTPMSAELLGSLTIDVRYDLIAHDFPRNKELILQKNGMNTVKLKVSYYKVQPMPALFKGTAIASSAKLVQQALIQAQLDGKIVDPVAILDMPMEKRLVFLSKVLEGPLNRLSQLSTRRPWEFLYFRATTSIKGVWVWCYWASKEHMTDKRNPKGFIPILSISAVLKNDVDGSRHQFMIRYQSKSGTKDMYLQRVDRDRDLWVDGLYEFIQMVSKSDTPHTYTPPTQARDVYSKNPQLTPAQQAAVDKAEELEKRRNELLSAAPAPGVKTLGTPISSDTEGPAERQSRRSSPAVEDMYRWLNNVDDEDGSDNGEEEPLLNKTSSQKNDL